MHVITDCPRCNNDFMYHVSDRYLIRQATITNSDGSSETIDTVICHECDHTEQVACFIEEKADHRGWENAECMAVDRFGKSEVEKAMKFISQNKSHQS